MGRVVTQLNLNYTKPNLQVDWVLYFYTMKNFDRDARFWMFTTKFGKILLIVFAILIVILIILEKVFGITL